jgi:uroporphyrinogen-III synthase
MRLLVTRPEPGASSFAEELRALGHEPVLQPLLEFRGLEFDPSPLCVAGALIVTSGNGIRALQATPHIHRAVALPLFCVGDETARLARSAGFRAVQAVAGTGGELIAKIISSTQRDARLVHVAGEHQAFDLAQALSREGLSMGTVRAYAMDARAMFDTWLVKMFRAQEIDGIILMSPRTAEVFVSLCHGHGLLEYAGVPTYFCLSESVAARLMPLKSTDMRIAARPNRKALLDLLARSDPSRRAATAIP